MLSHSFWNRAWLRYTSKSPLISDGFAMSGPVRSSGLAHEPMYCSARCSRLHVMNAYCCLASTAGFHSTMSTSTSACRSSSGYRASATASPSGTMYEKLNGNTGGLRYSGVTRSGTFTFANRLSINSTSCSLYG